MSPCERYDALVESMLADELDHDGLDRLLAHAETCAGCRSFVELHHQLGAVELDADLPTDAAFAGMRRRVLRELKAERRASWREWLGLDTVVRPAFAGALAAAFLLTVFGAGWWLGRSGGSPTLLPADGMITGLVEEARDNRLLSDVEDSPYIYSNVAFQPAREGRVALRFDVTRHLEVDRPSDDPLVRELLVQSLINPTPVGTRLQALDHATPAMDPKLKEALIFSVLNDDNQAVRLRALELVGEHAADDEVQQALLVVLREGESVQLRLMAIDLLAGNTSEERLGEVMDELDQRDDRAVLMRAASYRPGNEVPR